MEAPLFCCVSSGGRGGFRPEPLSALEWAGVAITRLLRARHAIGFDFDRMRARFAFLLGDAAEDGTPDQNAEDCGARLFVIHSSCGPDIRARQRLSFSRRPDLGQRRNSVGNPGNALSPNRNSSPRAGISPAGMDGAAIIWALHLALSDFSPVHTV